MIARELAPKILTKIRSRGNQPTSKADIGGWIREERMGTGETASAALAHLVLRELKAEAKITGQVEFRAA
jgi:hypothetical protein